MTYLSAITEWFEDADLNVKGIKGAIIANM